MKQEKKEKPNNEIGSQQNRFENITTAIVFTVNGIFFFSFFFILLNERFILNNILK